MGVRTEIDELLNKRVDRKDFIKHLLFGLFALTGLSWTLRMLVGKHRHVQDHSDIGYGGSSYGGLKDDR